jgi:hypothetical protein
MPTFSKDGLDSVPFESVGGFGGWLNTFQARKVAGTACAA